MWHVVITFGTPLSQDLGHSMEFKLPAASEENCYEVLDALRRAYPHLEIGLVEA